MALKPFRYFIVVWVLLLGGPGVACVLAQVRQAVYAGKFYPADGKALLGTIERLTQQARRNLPRLPSGSGLRALILPHAGYVYSGLTAAHAVHVLDNSHFNKVILLGPDHRVGFKNGAVSAASAWATPLGRIKLHPHARVLKRQKGLFRPVAASDATEHSLEVILPFLQIYLPEFELVPVALGPCDPKAVAQAFEGLIDRQTLMVASADLSHYLSYEEAMVRDQETINAILNLDSTPLLKDAKRSCGRYPIAVLLHLARKHQWQPVLLHRSNSGDTAGDRRQVVGYAAIAFYGEQPMTSSTSSPSELTPAQGKALVSLARQTLMKRFARPIPEDQKQQLTAQLNDPGLQAHSGTFVTLKIGPSLRGCIGSLTGNEPLAQGVRTNAVNAAFHDPRFRPLAAKELDKIHIEVSVLTEPQSLAYVDADDLLAKLRPHVDGVTIRKGFAGATFLPQVWEQLPKTETFLSHLCMKAGLPEDAWRQGDLEVETYQVQYFEEPH